MNETVFILWWSYLDGSDMDIERVYIDKQRAKEDYDLLIGLPDGRQWELKEVEITGRRMNQSLDDPDVIPDFVKATHLEIMQRVAENIDRELGETKDSI